MRIKTRFPYPAGNALAAIVNNDTVVNVIALISCANYNDFCDRARHALEATGGKVHYGKIVYEDADCFFEKQNHNNRSKRKPEKAATPDIMADRAQPEKQDRDVPGESR